MSVTCRQVGSALYLACTGFDGMADVGGMIDMLSGLPLTGRGHVGRGFRVLVVPSDVPAAPGPIRIFRESLTQAGLDELYDVALTPRSRRNATSRSSPTSI